MVKKWYALKVFYNRFSEIEATLSRDGIESYIPMKTWSYPQPDGEVVTRRVPLVAMLIFLCCDDDYISSLDSILDGKAMVYHHPRSQPPFRGRDGHVHHAHFFHGGRFRADTVWWQSREEHRKIQGDRWGICRGRNITGVSKRISVWSFLLKACWCWLPPIIFPNAIYRKSYSDNRCGQTYA